MSEAAQPVVRSGRWKRVTLWSVGGTFGALLLLFAWLLWWMGSEGSLARTLILVQRWLPEEQQLVFTEVTGSLGGGGHIASLGWSKPGTTLTLENLRLEWTLRELLGRRLHVRVLSVQRLHLRSTPQPDKPDEPPFVMPEQVLLPIRFSVPVNVARVEIESVDEAGTASVLALDSIAARYDYDGEQHVLQLASLQYGQSQLRADARLHATTLAVAARVDASLRNLVPDTPFSMQALVTANGSLAEGEAAALDIVVDARQQEVQADEAARVQARATIHPWRQQPAQQVDLEVEQLNARAFHAQAPVTSLHGKASVQPAVAGATEWNAEADFSNDRAGAWDRQQLPLRELVMRARLSLQQVDIETARAELGGRAPAGEVTLDGNIPLGQPLQSTLRLDLRRVDLQPLLTSLPRSSFTGGLILTPLQSDSRRIEASIRNALPGPLDQQRVPLENMLADMRMTPAQWRIEKFDAQLRDGRAQLRGHYAPETQALDLRGELQQLPLREIHRKMANDVAARLSGKAAVSGSLKEGIDFEASVSSEASAALDPEQRGAWEIRALETKGSWSPTRLTIERIHADAMQAKADGSDISVSLPDMDDIKATLTAEAPGIQLSADAAMRQQSGGGKVSLRLASAEQVEDWLLGLPIIGERMAPLRARGAASFEAEWQGGWRQWLAGFENPASQPRLHLDAQAHTGGLRIELPETATQSATEIEVRKLDLDLQGNFTSAMLVINGDARANEAEAQADVRMKTTQVRGSGGAPRWNLDVEKFLVSTTLFEEGGAWQLELSDNLEFSVQTGEDMELTATTGSATITAPPAVGATVPLQVAWQPVTWRRNARGAMTLQSTGTITGLQPAWLDVLMDKDGEGPLARAGMRTDLVLSGEWDVRMTDSMNIRAHLKRDSGDLGLVESETVAGIRTLDVTVQAQDENVSAKLEWDTQYAGLINASVGTRFEQETGGWSLPPTAPLSGTVQAKLPDLATWAFLVPPGWRIQGTLDANVRLAGTVQQPELNGALEGNDLHLRSVLDGVDLHDGTLRATLRESRMEITELTFQGGTGSSAYVRGFSGNRTAAPKDRGRMTAHGSIDWSGVDEAGAPETGIVMDVEAQLRRMQVLVRNDRQMTLSGDLAASLKEGQLRVRGDLEVDRATILLPEASAPTLGDDVFIVRSADLRNPSAVEARQARGELQTRKPLDMEITLDLGRDLALEGQGITTRLEGELTVRSASYGSEPFSVYGEVRTVEGRYRAWGQVLDIETGVVRFNGSYLNPYIDLLAIRPQIEVRAGVRVTGSLVSPRVQLFSEPELPEGEKLSWVVLGKASVMTGAEGTSMQQAALSLAAGQLSGRLASGLGVDELGLTDSGVSIGKRISNELYLTYQQGLAGATSTLFIFYDITRRLTVRGQASEASAVDLVYTIKYD